MKTQKLIHITWNAVMAILVFAGLYLDNPRLCLGGLAVWCSFLSTVTIVRFKKKETVGTLMTNQAHTQRLSILAGLTGFDWVYTLVTALLIPVLGIWKLVLDVWIPQTTGAYVLSFLLSVVIQFIVSLLFGLGLLKLLEKYGKI